MSWCKCAFWRSRWVGRMCMSLHFFITRWNCRQTRPGSSPDQSARYYLVFIVVVKSSAVLSPPVRFCLFFFCPPRLCSRFSLFLSRSLAGELTSSPKLLRLKSKFGNWFKKLRDLRPWCDSQNSNCKARYHVVARFACAPQMFVVGYFILNLSRFHFCQTRAKYRSPLNVIISDPVIRL